MPCRKGFAVRDVTQTSLNNIFLSQDDFSVHIAQAVTHLGRAWMFPVGLSRSQHRVVNLEFLLRAILSKVDVSTDTIYFKCQDSQRCEGGAGFRTRFA